MATVRWTLTEKATDETWQMPANPNTMSPLPNSKSLSVTPGGRIFESAEPAQSFQWGGVILHQAHYDALAAWARKPGVIVVTDHLQRTFEILIEAFRPAPEPGRRPGVRRQKYTMTALLLRRLA